MPKKFFRPESTTQYEILFHIPNLMLERYGTAKQAKKCAVGHLAGKLSQLLDVE